MPIRLLEPRTIAGYRHGEGAILDLQDNKEEEWLVDRAYAEWYSIDGDDALAKSNNLADLPDKSVARGNLGLGALATQDSIYFAASGGDDTAAINSKLQDSATQLRPILLDGKFFISSTIEVPTNATILATRSSTIQPLNGLADAMIFQAGNALGRHTLPTFSGFTGVALEIRCSLADIYVPQFHTCGTAIKFRTGIGDTTSSVLDTVVRFDAIALCENALIFEHGTTSDVIQGCGAIGNFITSTKNCVVFNGVQAFNDGLFIDVLAIDFTTTKPGGALMTNNTPAAVSRFSANVRSWLGGGGFSHVTPTQIAVGTWISADLNLVNSRHFTSLNLASNLLQASSIRLRQGYTKATAPTLVTLAEGQTVFNGGVIFAPSDWIGKIVLTADCPAGGVVIRYFYHALADVNYQPWSATVMSGADGFVLGGIDDQSGTEAGRVKVALVNASSSTIPSGTTKYIRFVRK